MDTVQEILTETARPTWSFRPGYGAPFPDKMTLSRSSASRTLDPASGLYKSVPSGERRISGPQQGLLVEADGRTNYLRWSSDVSQWNVAGSSLIGTQPSIIGNENNDKVAHIHEGYDNSDRVGQASAGIFSSSFETAWFIGELIEDQSQGSSIDLLVDSLASGDQVAQAGYDFSNGNINTSFDTVKANAQTLQINGNPGVLLAAVYDPSVGSYGGEGRRIKLRPARGNVKTQVAWHHAQIEEQRTATSPIVTGSNEVTRDRDDISIDIDPLNPNERTFLVTFTPQFFYFNPYQNILSLSGGGGDYLKMPNSSFPKPIVAYDGDNSTTTGGTIKKFQKNKVAVSVTDNKIRLAGNGDVSVGDHNGDLLINDTLKIGRSGRLQVSINNIAYYPKALSKSTLETLTI